MENPFFSPTAQQQSWQTHQLFGLQSSHSSIITPPLREGLTDITMSHTTTPYEYNDYASLHFPALGGAVLRPPQPQHSPPDSLPRHSIDMVRDDLGQYIYSDFIEDPLGVVAQGSTRSSSEEKDAVTPAQSRRKAQNRAAQRAFRERKERRVRDLEQKLTDLQAQSMTLHADNERLKRELAKVATENEILRATTATTPTNTSHGDYAGSEEDEASMGKRTTSAPPPTINGPKKFPSLDVRKNYANILKTGALPHRIVLSAETGDKLLDARATWDFIQNHPLFKQGLVDIGDVCERLKTFTKCDGQGPVFEEGRVRKVIEESVASGNDELI